MGIEFKIDPDAGVIYVKVLGTIVVKEVEAVRAQWQSHPDFRTGLDMIYDFREGFAKLTGEEAHRLAQYFKTARPVRRLAIVAVEAFAWGRIYQGWTGDDVNLKVFKDMQSAREWLGLPSEDDS